MHTETELKTGNAALWDTFAGLVPVKVTAITGVSGNASTGQKVFFTITDTRGPYAKNEQSWDFGLHVVPKKSVFLRDGQYRIRQYNVITD